MTHSDRVIRAKEAIRAVASDSPAAGKSLQSRGDEARKDVCFMRGTYLISQERDRQLSKGYGARHDDTRKPGELGLAAAMILEGSFVDENWWGTKLARHVREKYRDAPLRRLAIAGALIAAEIDHQQRAYRRNKRKEAKS